MTTCCPNCPATAIGVDAASICTECAAVSVGGVAFSLPLLFASMVAIGLGMLGLSLLKSRARKTRLAIA